MTGGQIVLALEDANREGLSNDMGKPVQAHKKRAVHAGLAFLIADGIIARCDQGYYLVPENRRR
jgi:hypothetical protein